MKRNEKDKLISECEMPPRLRPFLEILLKDGCKDRSWETRAVCGLVCLGHKLESAQDRTGSRHSLNPENDST